MKVFLSEIKEIIKEGQENKELKKILEDSLNSAFNENISVVGLNEKKVLVYGKDEDEFYMSEYHFDKENKEFVLEGLKKINVEDDRLEEGIFEETKEIFDISETESFKKKISEIKEKIILEKENIFESTDEFLNRIKSETIKNSVWLRKDGVKKFNDNEFLNRMKNISNDLKKKFINAFKEKLSKKDLKDVFYYVGQPYSKFSYKDGKDLYKKLNIKLPLNLKKWINENIDILKKYDINYEEELKRYGSIVDDTIKFLKEKEYIDEDKNVSKEKIGDLLGFIKRKEVAKKKFWKDKFFNDYIKEVLEDKEDVEMFLETFEFLKLMDRKEMESLFEKSSINIYNSPEKIKRAFALAEVCDFIIKEGDLRNKLVNEILSENEEDVLVKDADELLNESELGYFLKAYRNPLDFTIIGISNLAKVIQDYIGRYREEEDGIKYDDLKVLSKVLIELNKIIARQRLTDNDKAFLSKLLNFISKIEDTDKDVYNKIQNDKDEYGEYVDNYEQNILDKGSQNTFDF